MSKLVKLSVIASVLFPLAAAAQPVPANVNSIILTVGNTANLVIGAGSYGCGLGNHPAFDSICWTRNRSADLCEAADRLVAKICVLAYYFVQSGDVSTSPDCYAKQ